MIRILLAVWLLWQAVSPEALQHMQAGAEAEKQKRFDVAIAEYKHVTELAPTQPEGFVSLGQAYMEHQDYGAAIAPLKHALELSPGLAAAHQLLGYALLAQGYNAEAIPHLEKVQERTALGIAQIGAGQLQPAVENLQAALAQHPNDPDLLYYLGRASGLLSKQSIDTLLAAYPDSARAHQALAENYYVLRQMPQAEREFLEALRLRPDTPELHLELGLVYAGSAQWPKAEEQFRAQTKLQPGNAEGAYRLGTALLQQGKAREARIELQRADRLQPDMPETLYSLGKAAALAGDPPAAEKAWMKLLTVEKTSDLAAQTHFALAGLYRKQGKTADAERETREFQKLQSPATQPERTQ
ncbi:MAG TPA: tetratricopeptide repeat protein [Terriglobales bacterium]|nr:tetratricopeptide repeat protein [Terriglobales bacterium]